LPDRFDCRFQFGSTTSERNKITGYLAWKWGTTARLDTGHPYKNNAPTV
jgi:hypothetical protein